MTYDFSPGAEFLLGVNYWPRSSAMHMWSRFDRGEIDEDLSHIRALGLRMVRFFLLWEAFQPAPGRIDQEMLAKLSWFLDRLAHHALLAIPTFFTGHMSGVNWLPEWALESTAGSGRFRSIGGGRERNGEIADFYTGALLEAQRTQVRVVGERFKSHPAIALWDLGNEFSNLREPSRPADAANWSAALTAALFEASGHPVTGGIHGEDITRDRNLRLSSLCAPWACATMHGYTAYSEFARDRLDPETVPFLAELTRSFAKKPVLFSEFGNPACPAEHMPCLDEHEMSVYARGVLERLHARGALGALWWCWTDYDPALAQTPPFDRAPHELRFGIVRSDGSEKPVAATLANFARAAHRIMPAAPALFREEVYFATFPESVAAAYTAYLDHYAV